MPRPSSTIAAPFLLPMVLPMVVMAACGAPLRGPTPIGVQAVAAPAGQWPEGPPPPTAGLPIPPLTESWTPPMAVAGDFEALARAVQGKGRVAVRLPAEWADSPRHDRIMHALRGVLPDNAEVALERGGVKGIVPGTNLPLRRTDETSRRPHYEPDVAIDAAQFRGRDDADPKAGVVVVFDQAALDADRWRSLPARTVGDCDGPRTALAAGQESALAELAPFLDHADLALWQVHRAALKAGLPKYRAELAPYRAPRERNEGEGEDAWQRQTCGHAYAKLVDTVGRCLGSADPCPWAPRVLLHGGAFIASVEPDVHVPEGCATVMGRDYAAELRRMAAEAGEVVAAKLDPGWTVLSHRFGTITEVFEALEDVCAPRRRRFADTDLAALRTRLREIGEDLAADELADPDPRWEVGPDIRHVPGLGAVHVSMRYEPGEGSLAGRVVQQARGLRELGLDRARCRSSERTPWVALVVDATNATVPFYGYFYEEELACDDLPPAAEADSDSAPAP